MVFFTELPPESAPTPIRAVEASPWLYPPKDELPVAVPLVRRLARVPGARLSLRRVDVYRAGVEFVLRFDMGIEAGLDSERERHLRDLLHPRGFRPDPTRQMRLGVMLSDGSRADATADSRGLPRGVEEPDGPTLTFSGGGGEGSGDRWTTEFRAWLWPLPPKGALTLYYLFEGIGIEEGSLEVEATELREASRDVLDVWTP